MTDIINRLRRWSHTEGCGCTRCTAANEIERLADENSSLRKVKDWAVALLNAADESDRMNLEAELDNAIAGLNLVSGGGTK